ncbi:ROK family transcriptional regulator [Alteribacillus sp. HJP-4]|uniref:ROK family transcriptional regulator n=1 Tax=Alteribacillus sp. HJP-4 TaxID=2775394 RepID=UPI0035CD38CE
MAGEITRTGNLKLIQELNRSIILNTIRKHEPISKSGVAKNLSISPTTVSTAVSELIKAGFVKEGGSGYSSGGRKPIMLEFNPDGNFIIAVSITNTDLTIGLVNMAAEIKEKKHYSFANFYSVNVIEHLISSLKDFISAHVEPLDYLGITIIAPGIVDSVKGTILYNSQLELHDVDITSTVQEVFNKETLLENDVNALALAEKEFGNYTSSNLVFVKLSDGVGAGAILNDKIFRGHNGGAGEFGHTSVDKNGMKCECGNNGCLESYVSWPTISGRIGIALKRGRKSLLRKIGAVDNITPELFVQGIAMEDELCLEIANDVASYLSTGLANIVSLYNPSLIILGGDLIYKNDYLLKLIDEKIRRKGMEVLTRDLNIQASALGEDYELIGAASVILQRIFQVNVLK